ncbi:DUF5666 domain-containing protein [Geobacter argillaceus]|uniref:DUF5666 domain-containing protein n=1 Tax=Geobacter argillaceus TaxID=345631 RepID=A0A562VKF8_9BACT|nr:DUF5666 domain-containing protein [Geobacter argillaceus]TWJ18264.1 hypothetical protein JN12_02667 [Geobacter argillaceus]
MKRSGILTSVAVALLSLAIAGCSGGGGAGTTPVSGFSKGVVTAKGSVTVNGVKFDTSSSDVTVEHSAKTKGDDSGVKVGMVVRIKGSVNGATGTATKIEFANNMEGIIDAGSIDAVNSTFKVFGQTVKAGPATIIEDSVTGQILFTDLVVGNVVEVSGLPDNNGVINATRIERKTGISTFELKGKVTAYTSGAATFTMTPTNSTVPIIVTIGTVTLPANFAVGMNVEVKTSGSGTTITASSIEVETELQPAEDEHVEVEGIISGFTATSFVVNGVTIDPNGMATTGLGNGIKVEVEGTFKNGVLVASKIKLEQENNVKLEGNVAAAADIGTSSIKLNGVTVSVDSGTLFKDSDNSGGKTPVVSFGLANIAVNDHLEIVGFVNSSGSVIATKIERRKASAVIIVQGPVAAANTTANTLTILGITVNIGSASLKDATGNPVVLTTFFTLVKPGTTVVKAKGSLSGTTLTATEAEIEQ